MKKLKSHLKTPRSLKKLLYFAEIVIEGPSWLNVIFFQIVCNIKEFSRLALQYNESKRNQPEAQTLQNVFSTTLYAYCPSTR